MGSAIAGEPEVNCRSLNMMELKNQRATAVDNRDQRIGWVHRRMLLPRLDIFVPSVIWEITSLFKGPGI